ncbi:MAG: alpha/beta hydrolase [Sporichthyaceae bacterium]|nr:alpha/beta hydrolase [Sporichthyaceae bacterium]
MPSVAEHSVALAGVTLRYREHGPASAPPIVLLHGLGEDAAGWDEIAAPLAESHRVIALDQRGHGASDRPGDYSYEAMRDDAGRLLDVLDLADVTLIGHSMGALTAALLAEQAPGRLGRLILVDAAPLREPLPAEEPPESPPGPVPFDWAALKAVRSQSNNPSPRWWDELDRITVPTLIISGGSASQVPPQRLAEAAERIPAGELVIVEGAGHFVHTAEPEIFLKLVTEFIAQHRAG